MEFRELKISVKNLLNLLNLLRGCKSISYKQKIPQHSQQIQQNAPFVKICKSHFVESVES